MWVTYAHAHIHAQTYNYTTCACTHICLHSIKPLLNIICVLTLSPQHITFSHSDIMCPHSNYCKT